AEDCIRDRNVTGVQTCALPIFVPDEHHRDTARHPNEDESEEELRTGRQAGDEPAEEDDREPEHQGRSDEPVLDETQPEYAPVAEIGRASCRERGEGTESGVALK